MKALVFPKHFPSNYLNRVRSAALIGSQSIGFIQEPVRDDGWHGVQLEHSLPLGGDELAGVVVHRAPSEVVLASAREFVEDAKIPDDVVRQICRPRVRQRDADNRTMGEPQPLWFSVEMLE